MGGICARKIQNHQPLTTSILYVVNLNSWHELNSKFFKIIYCLFDHFLDEFETPAAPKPKETEAQPEPEDGGEDGREEGY